VCGPASLNDANGILLVQRLGVAPAVSNVPPYVAAALYQRGVIVVVNAAVKTSPVVYPEWLPLPNVTLKRESPVVERSEHPADGEVGCGSAWPVIGPEEIARDAQRAGAQEHIFALVWVGADGHRPNAGWLNG